LRRLGSDPLYNKKARVFPWLSRFVRQKQFTPCQALPLSLQDNLDTPVLRLANAWRGRDQGVAFAIAVDGDFAC
jgi:hypothetical protein